MGRLCYGVLFYAVSISGATRAAPVGRSELPFVTALGVKYPNSADEGSQAVISEDRALATASDGSVVMPPFAADASQSTELIPFMLASPDQEDAGSCLYMSLTGIAESWLARRQPELPRTPDGPLDLSERYMMNMAGIDEDKDTQVANWRTDSILLFNAKHQSVRNSAYRFTKGWSVRTPDQDQVAATATTPGATYSTSFNWIDQRAQIKDGYVALPTFTRQVLFADSSSDQWNVGVAPAALVEQVKTALRTKHAPVHVIYNHFGYWHAVVIVGYDDNISNNQCSFVSRSLQFFATNPGALRAQAEAAASVEERSALLAAADKSQRTHDKLQAAYQAAGGCHGDKGIFYVRDSIYSDQEEPVYHFDPVNPAADGHYSRKIVIHEYDWLRYLANHAVQIFAVD